MDKVFIQPEHWSEALMFAVTCREGEFFANTFTVESISASGIVTLKRVRRIPR